jgi:hypothetical protein
LPTSDQQPDVADFVVEQPVDVGGVKVPPAMNRSRFGAA